MPVAAARDSSLLALTPGSADSVESILPLLSTVLVGAFWVALTFSTMTTVSVSPTMRARWSSNSGRYIADW